MREIKLLQLSNGRCPYQDWVMSLSKVLRVRVDAYVKRVGRGGARKHIKSVGGGIFEIKVPVGPGLRVYFSESEDFIILLLLGGDKSTQSADIKKAKEYWRCYCENKRL